MPKDISIPEIVETYALPPSAGSKVITKASLEVRLRGLTSFKAIYECVDQYAQRALTALTPQDVVTRENRISRWNKGISLDQLDTYEDKPGGRTYHEKIGYDPREKTAEHGEETVSFQDAISGFVSKVSDDSIQLLKLLANANPYSQMVVGFGSPQEIEARLTELRMKYTFDGRLIIPCNIKSVKFTESGLRVIRSRGGRLSPEERQLVVEAYERYGGNGSQAAKHLPFEESTFYRTWKREGLYVKPRTLSEDDIAKIIRARALYKNKQRKAARNLPYSRYTIAKVWRGLESEIVAAHADFDGNAYAASLKLPYSSRFIRNIWREHNIRPKKRILDDGDILNILLCYVIYDGNAEAVARKTKYKASSVLKKWKEAGLIGGRSKKTDKEVTAEDIEEIIRAHMFYSGNASEAARNLTFGRTTITKYWKRSGLKPKSRTPNPEQLQQIIQAHSIYSGNAKEAAKHLPYGRTAVTKYWINAGLEPAVGALTREQLKEVMEAYAIYKGNASEAARHLPYNKNTFLDHWKKAQLKIIHRLTASDKAQVVIAFKKYNGNALEAARNLGFDKKTILGHWRKRGLIK